MVGSIPLLAFNMVSNVAFGYLRSQIASGAVQLRPRPRADGAMGIPSVGEGHEGCPVCDLHAHVAEGSLLLKGLAETCRREGSIPPGIGGILPLARRHFQDAEGGAGTIAVQDAGLRARALEVQGRLVSLSADMQREVTADQLPGLAQQAEAAWQMSYDLADQAFRQDGPETPEEAVAHDPLYQWIRRVRDEGLDAETAYTELQKVLPQEGERGS